MNKKLSESKTCPVCLIFNKMKIEQTKRTIYNIKKNGVKKHNSFKLALLEIVLNRLLSDDCRHPHLNLFLVNEKSLHDKLKKKLTYKEYTSFGKPVYSNKEAVYVCSEHYSNTKPVYTCTHKAWNSEEKRFCDGMTTLSATGKDITSNSAAYSKALEEEFIRGGK